MLPKANVTGALESHESTQLQECLTDAPKYVHMHFYHQNEN